MIGAGVAGLQAIATAKRLGAVVEAFDVRPAVKEQVESLGARFVEVPLSEEELRGAESNHVVRAPVRARGAFQRRTGACAGVAGRVVA